MILTAALVAATLAAAPPQRPQPSVRPPAEQERSAGERPHQVGIGGSMVVSNQGASGGLRYFFSERLGVNVMAGWSNNQTTAGGSSTFVMPSMLYMLTPPNLTRDVDIRPYVGAG